MEVKITLRSMNVLGNRSPGVLSYTLLGNPPAEIACRDLEFVDRCSPQREPRIVRRQVILVCQGPPRRRRAHGFEVCEALADLRKLGVARQVLCGFLHEEEGRAGLI